MASPDPPSPIVTRFAPSPTGFLHIGGARTALFNWLFARKHGGRFLLRIEDTDRARSTDDAVAAILDGLSWLGLGWDGDPISQFGRAGRHREIATQLLEKGLAYRCYASQEELARMREMAKAEGRPMRYDGRWRDRDPAEAPEGVDPVIRLRAPQTGQTVIEDLVQGTVSVENAQLDDFVLLRADGSPTYMLAVVVDDFDMGITHVIRGDDHLNNAFRQQQIYDALGWKAPFMAHIPLIHGPDGAKLSKRHGALGIDAYRDMGYLPEALRNALLRLGWGHGDEEIIPTERALGLFDLAGVGRGAARIDFDKLNSLNGHYLRDLPKTRILDAVRPFLQELVGTDPDEAGWERVEACLDDLTPRAKTLVELAEQAAFLVKSLPLDLDAKAAEFTATEHHDHLRALQELLGRVEPFTGEVIESAVRELSAARDTKLGALAQPLRAALTGRTVSPPIFQAAAVLGRESCLARIDDALQGRMVPPSQ